MGKYDIGAELTNDCKLTAYDLAIEIVNEFGEYDAKSIEMKLGNSKSGLLYKLKKILNFDAKEMAKNSKEEQFRMYKLLKVLYKFEKYGEQKRIRAYNTETKIKIPIIDILAKPRMSNIDTYLVDSNKFDNAIDQCISIIKKEVDDAEARIDLIDKIDDQWQYIAQKQFDYVTSDMALSDPDSALKELKRINQKLDNIISDIESESKTIAIPTEGVMKTFFNMLLIHKKLCYLTDRISMESFLSPPQRPDDKFIALYKKYESQVIYVDKIPVLAEALKNKDNPEILTDLLNLLSYFEGIPKSDYKHYIYAFEHCETVIHWLMKEKDGIDFSKEVPMSVFVSIIQEIVYVKKNIDDFKVKNDYKGFNASGISLMSVLKKQNDDEVTSVLVDIWNRRVENRFCANYGVIDLINEKNKAEIKALIIRKHIFSHNNLLVVKKESDALLHKVSVAHTNTSVAANIETLFRIKLSYKLETLDVFVEHFEFPDNADNIYDMFRELLYAYGNDIDDKLEEISQSVTHMIFNQELYECNDSYYKEMECKFIINFPNGINQNCALFFYYNSKEKIFSYKKFIIL